MHYFLIHYQYDSLGNLKALTYPGGEVVTYQYNVAGLMTGMTLTSNTGGTLYTWGYTYDNYGRLHTITRPDGTTEERSYNLAGSLVHQVERDKAGTIIQKNDYTYNVFGEIIEKTTSQSGNPAKMTAVSMNYNSANRLTKWDNKTVHYDDVGNMLEGPVNGDMQTLTYDCRNRLTKAGDITYSYDAENNRIATAEDGLTTEYVYDTSGSLSQLLVAYEPDSTSTIYVYGAEGLAAQYNTGTKKSLFYHFDNIGSTTLLTDLTGQVIERIAYGTYGELLTDVKTAVRFLYNGSYGVMTDSNGLYYMRARYYNPDIKRFINQDIKVGDISNSQSLNRYAYCEGNPVSMVDPFGLCGQDPNALTIHDILGLIGFASSFFGLPGMAVGAMADAVDFVLYCKEKDPLNAVLALICVVPVVGDAVGLIAKGGRYLRTGAKIANLLQDSGKMIKSADKAVSAFKINQNIKQSGIGNGIATVLYAAGKMLIRGMKKGSTKLLDFGSVIKKQAESLYTSAKSAVKRLSKGSVSEVDVRFKEESYYSYNELRKLIKDAGLSGKGIGLEAHHLLEKQYAKIFGVNQGDIISVALTPKWHRGFNGEKLIGEGVNLNSKIEKELMNIVGVSNRLSANRIATPKQIWQAHKRVYEEIGHSEWASALYEAYVKKMGIDY